MLREIRVSAGDGIKTAAPKLDVDYSYLSKLENGLSMPSANFLERFASQYAVSLDTLFLAAGRLPPDIVDLISKRPEAVIEVLRRKFPNDKRG